MAGAVLIVFVSGFRSALGWYPLEILLMGGASSPARGWRCELSVFWIELVDWLLLAYGEAPSRISLRPWLILLSTLSRRDAPPAPISFPCVAV
jgi:hypothetical protein